ncbi:MAG: protein kinase [Deltaproteobacteria bacterium]|nr:protein kinase [Deltaproteobacteria bacterium]
MDIQCPKCNTKNTSDSKFCKKCATPLPSSKEISLTQTLETSIEELTRGSTFAGRYEIIEELGQGGMGKVYRVFDKKIEEEAALKLLKPEIAADKKTIERFRNELKLARKVAHRNVCRMYDLDEEKGTHYITMEYVPGEDLKSFLRRAGPINAGKAISIGKQVCEGLAEAHRLGVVHRDLKPQNIMIDREGNARIMDFGIARSLKTRGITGVGVMIGTPEYMSPEQAEGKEVDKRSDIYSLGVILYEMVTGRLPFKGVTPLSIAMKHKGEEPPHPRKFNAQVPEDFSRLILRCMEKDKEKRYQSAKEVFSELEKIEKGLSTSEKIVPERKPITSREITVTFGLKKLFIPAAGVVALGVLALIILQLLHKKEAGPLPSRRYSVAVLPFEDLSAQKDQAYFCDGIAAELINRLANIENLRVPARASSFSFKGKDLDIQEIGKKLDANFLLVGSLQKAGARLRITAELVKVSDGYPIWSEKYEGSTEDIFALQDKISLEIVDNLKIKLLGEKKAKLVKRHTENPEAYNLYLKGRFQYDKLAFEKAIDYFKKAVEIDPNYALAYAMLADCYVWLGWSRELPLEEASTKAMAFITKALEIDETNSEAHYALAQKKFYLDWDWEGGIKEIERAIELNPRFSHVHGEYAWYLMVIGRFEEAISAAKLAVELDPLAFLTTRTLAYVYYCARQYDLALEQYQQMTDLMPNDPRLYRELAMVYEQVGRYEDAVRARQKAMTLSGDPPEEIESLGRAFSESGPKGYWMWHLERLKGQYDRYPDTTARYYTQLGDKDQALAWLERAYEKHGSHMHRLKVQPWWDPLRSDPRFQDLLRRMNFPD